MIKLLLGDCQKKMSNLKENSIDTIITDPPYGLKFMNKKWDYEIPSIKIFQEMLRVAKPGATLLCFAGSRTQHRMAVNIEDAGWILKDCILWIFGQGFPKATDISKGIDRKFGAERKVVGRTECGYQRKGRTDEEVFSKGITKKEREVPVTTPSTPEAQLWDGWKSHSLKPAYETVILAMKPNDQTYVENALKWGVSGLNIDGSRVSVDRNKEREYDKENASKITGSNKCVFKMGENQPRSDNWLNQGRFPANIILDQKAAKILDDQSGISKSSIRNPTGKCYKPVNAYAVMGRDSNFRGQNDQGSVSRYFKIIDQTDRFYYCAKASRKERNLGCEDLEMKKSGGMKGTEDQTLLTGSGNIRNNMNKNSHPTIKPLSLIKYLSTLTKTSEGGVVLDPFMGSGTTGMACLITNRDFIGIEIDREYYKIAQERIRYVMVNQKEMQREYKLELIKKKRRENK